MQESFLHLFNTETRKKEVVTPSKSNTILMYTCGPTVYNFAHIGNFRTYVFEDLLRRTIQFFDMKIHHVMNLTDIDDKTIKGALEMNVPLKDYTKTYIDAFFQDIDTLCIQRAEAYPAATDYIPKMISIIQTLIDKGYAYKAADGSIYYSIQNFPSYGRLSHLHLDELKPCASERLITDEYEKDNIADFVLWKIHDPERDGPIFWESPFGRGRPGWHIECSAMAIQLLGETIDIHVGGIDNMFPHHENEIAQSEACTGKRFARYWLHSEHLLVDHKKMSKSLGNFYTLRDLLSKGYTGRQVRYMLLQSHYRTQLNFTFQGLDATCKTLERLDDFTLRLKFILEPSGSIEVAPIIDKALQDFKNGLGDDLNISVALAALFDFLRIVNGYIDQKKLGKKQVEEIFAFLKRIDMVLGVLSLEEKEETFPKDVLEALAKRQEARQNKDWKQADVQRDFIHLQGYVIEDTPQGARLKKSRPLEREES